MDPASAEALAPAVAVGQVTPEYRDPVEKRGASRADRPNATQGWRTPDVPESRRGHHAAGARIAAPRLFQILGPEGAHHTGHARL